MHRPHLDKNILASILSGSSSHAEENHFAMLCLSLADEAIGHHIQKRRLQEEHRRDVIHDAFVKLFVRNSSGEFPRIGEYIKKTHPDFEAATEEELLRTLRTVIVGSVYQAVIENLKRRDRVLSDILRSIDHALRTTSLFYKMTRFNDKYLIPREADRLRHCHPIPVDFILQQLQRSVQTSDSVPQLLRKLHTVLVEQDEYQRIVPLVDTAIVFKTLRGEAWTGVVADSIEGETVRLDLESKIEQAAARLHEQMYQSYVGKGKWTEAEYNAAIRTARDSFLNKIQSGNEDNESFFELMRQHLPTLSKEDYRRHYKHRVEYLVTLMKKELESVGKELRD